MLSNDLQKKVAIYQELERRGEIQNLPPEKQAAWAELKRRGVAGGQQPAPQAAQPAAPAPVAAPAPTANQQGQSGGVAGFGEQVYETLKGVAQEAPSAVASAGRFVLGGAEELVRGVGGIWASPIESAKSVIKSAADSTGMVGEFYSSMFRRLDGMSYQERQQALQDPEFVATMEQWPEQKRNQWLRETARLEKIAGVSEDFTVPRTDMYTMEEAGTDLRDNVGSIYIDPEFENSASGRMTQGIGTMVPTVAAGAAGPGVMLMTSAGLLGQEGIDDYRDTMKRKGLEPVLADEAVAGALNAALAPTEFIPVQRMLMRMDKASGGTVGKILRRYLLDAGASGIEEAIAEVIQTVGQNYLASDILAYDEARELGLGVTESAYGGFSVGTVMQALLGLPGTTRQIRSRGNDPESELKDPEAVPTMDEQMDGLNGTQTDGVQPPPAAPAQPQAPRGGIQLADGSTMRSVQDIMADQGVQPRQPAAQAAQQSTVARIIEENRRAKAERQEREQKMAPYSQLQQKLAKEFESAAKRKDTVDVDRDDILTAIAKLGGLDPDELGGEVDIATMRDMQRVGRPIVRKSGEGKTLDHMAEILGEDGFTGPDGETLDPNSLLDLIDSASRGDQILSRNANRDNLIDPDNDIARKWFGGSRDRLLAALQKHIDGKPLTPNQQGAVDDLTNYMRGGDESIYRERDIEAAQDMDLMRGEIPIWFGELQELDPAGAEATMQGAALQSIVGQELDPAEQQEHLDAMVDWGLNDFTTDAGERAQGIEPGIANLAIQAAAAGANIDEINAAMDMAGDNPSAAIGALMGMAAREEVIDEREIAALDWEYERSEGAQPAGPERDSDAAPAADYEQDARLERDPAGGIQLAGSERGPAEIGGGIDAAPEGAGPADTESQQAPDSAESVESGDRRRTDRHASSAEILQKFLDGEELTRDEAIRLATQSPVTPLPNKIAFIRAWREHQRRVKSGQDAQMPLVVSIDADSLKWVNDNLSHDDGDYMLRAIGEALAETGADAFHLSGDEFAIITPTAEAGEAAVAAAQEILSRAEYEATGIDGRPYTIKGFTLTHGIGANIKAADAEMQSVKARKEEAGERASRGEKPSWIHAADESGSEGSDVQSRQENGGSQTSVTGSESEGSPEGLTLTPAEAPAKAGASGFTAPQQDDLLGKTPEQDRQQALTDEQAKRDKKRDEQAARAELQSDGPLFDGTLQQQDLVDKQGVRAKVVNPDALEIALEKGDEYMVWPYEGGTGFKRAFRPITKANPNPSLFSPNYPPTYDDANAVERAFGLPLTPRPASDTDGKPVVAKLVDGSLLDAENPWPAGEEYYVGPVTENGRRQIMPVVNQNGQRTEWGGTGPMNMSQFHPADVVERAFGLDSNGNNHLKRDIDAAANEAATSPENDRPEPTEAQIEAGNYKKGHIRVAGLDITIENPRGSKRRGTDPDGNQWEQELKHHYGYIKRTEGADGEHIDVFVGKKVKSDKIFIVDQINADGSFDEHKVMVGFESKAGARTGYRANYQKGWNVGPVNEISLEEFKLWLDQGDTTSPFFEYMQGNELGEDTSKAAKELTAKRREEISDRFEEMPEWDYEVANFPTPKKTVSATANAGKKFITPEEAAATLAEWKAEARRMGETVDNSNLVILSLFDYSGQISKPWREAGFDVRQYDIKLDDDLMEYFPMGDLIEIQKQGKKVVGVIAQPPCTCFTSSGARWWKKRHDATDRAMVDKMFGPRASRYFSRPLDYTKALVSFVDAIVGETSDTLAFFAMENPVGRIATEMGLPVPTMSLDPHVYGDAYTKFTQLWGQFNTDLPTANVEPTEGSLMHKLWSDAEKGAGLRSITPEGFSYAFFMANKDAAAAKPVQGKKLPVTESPFKRGDLLMLDDGVLVEVTDVSVKNPSGWPANSTVSTKVVEFTQGTPKGMKLGKKIGFDGDSLMGKMRGGEVSRFEPARGTDRAMIQNYKAMLRSSPVSSAWDVFVDWWFSGEGSQGTTTYTFELDTPDNALVLGNLQRFAQGTNNNSVTFSREIPADIATALGLMPTDFESELVDDGSDAAEKRRRDRTRKLRNEKTIIRGNGRPWSSRDGAQQKLKDWDLTNTHYVRSLGNGKFELARLPAASIPRHGLWDNVGYVWSNGIDGGGWLHADLPAEIVAAWTDGKVVKWNSSTMDSGEGNGRPMPADGEKVVFVGDPEAAADRLAALQFTGQERLEQLNDRYPDLVPSDEDMTAKRKPVEKSGLAALDAELPIDSLASLLFGEGNIFEAIAAIKAGQGYNLDGFEYRKVNDGTEIIYKGRVMTTFAGAKSKSAIGKALLVKAAEQMQSTERAAEKAFRTSFNLGSQTSSTKNMVEATGTNTFSVMLSGNEGISGEVRFIMGKEQVGIFYYLTDETTGLTISTETHRAPHMEGAVEMALGFAQSTQQDILYRESKKEAAQAPAQEAAPDPSSKEFGASNKLVTQSDKDEALALIRSKLRQLNAGIDPELMAATTKVAVYYIEAGVRKFPDFVKAMVEALGTTDIIPWLQSSYEAARWYPGMDQEGMTPTQDVTAMLVKAGPGADTESQYRSIIEEIDNESGASADLGRDSQNAAPADAVGQDNVQAGREGSGRAAADGASSTDAQGRGRQSDRRPADRATPAGGEPGNLGLDFGDEPAGNAAGPARSGGSVRGVVSRRAGAPAQSEAGREVKRAPASGEVSLSEKRKQQDAANSIPVRLNDPANVAETLPYLLSEQIDDVVKIEARLIGQDKAGVLVTNGTGTGKTYTGGGTIARFYRAGKTEQLIVVPSQAKAQDWIVDMANLGIEVNLLESIKDKGKPGVNITTYANFSQNMYLLQREWDMVTYDESHRLNQNQDNGGGTEAQSFHYAHANKPGSMHLKAYARDPRYMRAWEERPINEKNLIRHAVAKYQKDTGLAPSPNAMEAIKKQAQKEAHGLFQDAIKPFINDLIEEAKRLDVEIGGNTKVQFLSATPFGYHFNLDYADGYLFDFPTSDDSSYNSASGRDGFYMAAFGYRKRYNKLTIPESGVDVNLMEREFHNQLKKEGALIGRQLDVPFDYSRDFITVDDDLGKQLDMGIKVVNGSFQFDEEVVVDVLRRAYKLAGEDPSTAPTDPAEARKDPHLPEFKSLEYNAKRHFNYAYVAQLREAVLARHVAPRIKKHLEQGRKVVLFHDYRKAPAAHPFEFGKFSPIPAPDDTQQLVNMRLLENEIELFQQLFPELVKLDLKQLASVDELVLEAFGDRARTFNGTVPNKVKGEAKRLFNDHNSGVDVIAVQRQSGKEGLSLHDVKGDMPRALIDLGLPIRPTDAIQTEGRVYRMGQQSDAIIEYPVLNLAFEQRAFGEKVAQRAKTPENLAMGDVARDLEMAFKEGYLNADYLDVNAEQGKGGKERDRTITALTDFDKAKTYYFANAKNSKRRDQREGKDYFATPEPLGFKMVEWLDSRANDRLLEPSAGHGAIARFFPGTARSLFVEPSPKLAAKLALNASGEIRGSTFEDLHIHNKFEGIAMNPPFGAGGSDAINHLEKASHHLANGGRIVAIIPTGPAADKKLDAFLYDDKRGKGLYQVARIKLPSVAFERAGTSVSTQIIVLERHAKPENAPEQISTMDLTHIETIGEFFDRISDMQLPPRRAAEAAPDAVEGDTEGSQPAGDPTMAAAKMGGMDLYQFAHSQTGEVLYMAIPQTRTEYDEYRRVLAVAKRFGGWYNKYAGGQAKRGFAFKDPSDRQRFLEALGGDGVAEQAPMYSYAPERTAWREGFPKALVINKPGEFQRHPDYQAAKFEGDMDAAYRLTRDMLNSSAIEELKRRVIAGGNTGKAPVIVAAHGKEGLTANRIPMMAAVNLAERTGWAVERSVVQVHEAARSGGDGFYRVANQPAFDGNIQPGRDYVIVDDTLTQGGTLASLKGFIESKGGRVVAAVAMEGKQYSSRLAPTSDTLEALKARWPGLEGWWNEEFGYSIDRLTNSEARYLAGVKGISSLAELRDRILAARRRGDISAGPEAGPARQSQSVTPEARQTAGLSASEVRKSIKKALGDRLSDSVVVVQSVTDLPLTGGYNSQPGASGRIEGLYTGGKVYLVADNLSGADRAAWVAWHELWHRGARGAGGHNLKAALERAQNNSAVAGLADAIMADRGMSAGDRLVAVEEALAELNAADETGNYAAIEGRYGVRVPAGLRSGIRGHIARFLDRIRAILRKLGIGKNAVLDRDVFEIITGARRSYERGVTDLQREAGTPGNVAENGPTQGDLFADAAPETKRAVLEAFTKAYLAETGTLTTNVRPLTDSYAVATMLRPWSDFAQELFIVVPLDENYMPMGIIRHSKGGFAEASVFPDVVAGDILMTGAKHYWIAHNHPSGLPSPSNADQVITNRITMHLDNLGISMAGHVILGSETFALLDDDGSSLGVNEYEDFVAEGEGKPVKVYERMLKRLLPESERRIPIDGPAAAKATILRLDMEGMNGILALDNKHSVLDVITFDGDPAKLRDKETRKATPEAVDFVRRLAEVGAVKGIVFARSQDRAENLSHLSSSVVGILDAMAPGYSAAEEGDAFTPGNFYSMAPARDITDTTAFKRWFGDSWVVDRNGAPLVVYHGTPDGRFIDQDGTFKSQKEKWGMGDPMGAHWFASSRSIADSYADDRRALDYQNSEPRTVAAYLRLENPLEVDAKGALWREAQARGKTSDVIEQAQQGGYDGVIIRNVRDRYQNNERSAPTDTFVVFSSEQIKAVDNDGGFDPTNPDIRYSMAPSDPQQLKETEAAKKQASFLKGILHQPIDRMFRLPFDALGMIDSHGRFKGGVMLSEGVKKAIANWRPHPEGRFHWMDNMLEVARAGLVDRYGLSDEYKTRWREAEAEERIRLTEGLDILRTLQDNKVGLKEARVLQAILTGEEIAEGDWNDLAEPIRRAIDDLGQELVSLGLLSAEAYQRNRGTYLHRSYLKHEASFTPVSKWVNDLMTSRRRKIVGNELKGRGIDARVHMSKLRKASPDNWWGARMESGKADLALKDAQFILFEKLAPVGEGTGTLDGMEQGGPKKRRVVERQYWPADLPVPAKFGSWENRGTWQVRSVKGSSVILWRDYTKAERMKMGEIVDARYNIAKTFEQLSHDIAIGRFFSDIAKNQEWFSAEEPQGKVISAATAGRMSLFTGVDWVQVPAGNIPGTQTSKWGALAGGYVRAEIWRDLNELDKMHTTGLWRQLLSQWKQNKTARSPVVHMNNVMSNLMFMDLADVRVTDLVDGLRSYTKQDEHYNDAIRHGAFEGSFVTQEIRNRILQPILDEIMAEQTGSSTGVLQTTNVIGKLTNGLMDRLKRFDEFTLDLYQMEDEIFRMATYMRRIELGDNPAEAAAIAREQFLDYDIRAPWVNAARRTVLPFISYTYRAVPVIAQSVAQRPWKLAKYFTLAQIWTAMAYSLAPGDEEEEERTMQDQKRGYTWIGVPRMLRMPWRDDQGNPMFLDIRRWIPAGDVFDTNQGTMGDLGVPAPLQISGPIMMAFELSLNKAAFTGDEIYQPLTDTAGDKVSGISDWAYKTWMPSAAYIPGSWYWDKIWNAGSGGTDYLGRPYGMAEAVVSSIGIKAQAHDVDRAKAFYSFEFSEKKRELAGKLRTLANDHRRNLIDDETFERKRDDLIEQLERLGGEARYFMTGEEPE